MNDEELRAEFAEWLRPIREADPPSMPVIRRRLRQRRARSAAAGTVALAAVAVVAVTLGPSLRHADLQASTGGHQSSASYTISSPITTLVVTAGTGEVRITGGDRSTVSVTVGIRYSATPPTTTYIVTGRTLRLAASCPGEDGCGVDYDIQVPNGIAVRVRLQTGAISLSQLAGPVHAVTGTGAISALELSGGKVSLRTGTGPIDAGFTAPPDRLQASTQSGEISIGLPGTVSYQVNAHALDTVINVQVNTSSPYVITASAGVGAITVVPGAPASSPPNALGGATAMPSGFPFGAGGGP
jgi:hypothetical protein